jgi:hypothetical protein
MLVNWTLTGDEELPTKTALHRRNFVRLVDKAVREYGWARNALIAQIEEPSRPVEELLKGRNLYIFVITDHLENCLNAVRRLLGHFDRLSDKARLGIDRVTRRKVKANEDSLRAIRDAIEHLDERIQKGTLAQNEAIMLRITSDQRAVELGDTKLRLVDLERGIRHLHAIAAQLIKAGK